MSGREARRGSPGRFLLGRPWFRFARFAKNRNMLTRVLWWTFLLTVVTGFAATVGWLDGFNHSTLGGVHGKIGFLMVALGIVHAVRHLRQKHRQRRF